MKNYSIIGVVTKAEYKSTSIYGNPSYWLTIKTTDGDTIKAYTASNASCGYGCTNGLGKTTYEFTAHNTSKGNTIVDYMQEIK